MSTRNYLIEWSFVSLMALVFATTMSANATASSLALETSLPTKLQYQSSFSGYQAYAEQTIQSWREANEQVGVMGGWRAYAKEALNNEPTKNTSTLTAPHLNHLNKDKP